MTVLIDMPSFSPPVSFLSVSLYNLLGGRKKEDEDTRVIRSVKKNLFKAEKCLKKGNYSRAEEACHAAMAILGSSKNSEKQVYLEAMAIVMDKVCMLCKKVLQPIMHRKGECIPPMYSYS